MLVETLTKHVGEQSALFKRLSPTDSEGLVAVLGERMRRVLREEHSEFEKALDPLQEDGAVGRFIAKLREELKRAEDDQAKQLKIALAALDTTKEDSLLNQMRRETQQARTRNLVASQRAQGTAPAGVEGSRDGAGERRQPSSQPAAESSTAVCAQASRASGLASVLQSAPQTATAKVLKTTTSAYGLVVASDCAKSRHTSERNPPSPFRDGPQERWQLPRGYRCKMLIVEEQH